MMRQRAIRSNTRDIVLFRRKRGKNHFANDFTGKTILSFGSDPIHSIYHELF